MNFQSHWLDVWLVGRLTDRSNVWLPADCLTNLLIVWLIVWSTCHLADCWFSGRDLLSTNGLKGYGKSTKRLIAWHTNWMNREGKQQKAEKTTWPFFLPAFDVARRLSLPFSTWWGVVVGTVWKSRVKLDFVIVSDTTSSSGYLNMWPL